MQRHQRGSNTTNWVHLMANNSTSAFPSDGKIYTALLNFGNAKRLCLFCFMRLCLLRLMRQNKMYGFIWADHDWIGLMIFKNFAEQDWNGFNFCRSGLDSDWKFHSPLISAEKAADPESWSRLRMDSAFFFRPGSGVKILWKNEPGSGVTFQFRQWQESVWSFLKQKTWVIYGWIDDCS